MIKLKWNYPSRLLKTRGYTFQKLYARNHKTYRKKIGDFTIWLWETEKSLEVDDWHGNTGNIIEFFKNNKQHFKKSQMFDFSSLKIQYNLETAEVQLFDYEEYYKIFQKENKSTDNCWDEWEEKYKDWRTLVISDKFERVIEEIEILSNYGK